LNLQLYAGQQPLGQSQYLLMVQDGVQLLRRNPELTGKVFVMDMANPFNALLDREPPLGVDSWNHAYRTFSEAVHRPPEQMFADTDVVMVPRVAVEYATFDLLRQVFGRYLEANFEPVARTGCWDAYRKKSPRAAPGKARPAV
jgi:hypothetical protein